MKKNRISVSADLQRINLTWSVATNSTGSIVYRIYGGPDLSSYGGTAMSADTVWNTPLKDTTDTAWEVDNPIIGPTYYFAVRAIDTKTGQDDGNTSVVTVVVSDGKDHRIPKFSGITKALVAADNKIVVHWNATPGPNFDHYNVYDLTSDPQMRNPTSTVATVLLWTVPAPAAGTVHTFLVKAANPLGEEDKNNVRIKVKTLQYTVPDFNGLSTVTREQAVAGMSNLDLHWRGVSNPSTITGYLIYMSTTPGAVPDPLSLVFDSSGNQIADDTVSFDQQPASPPGIQVTASDPTQVLQDTQVGFYVTSNINSVTVTGLNSGTTYYFVVRAFLKTVTGGTASYITDLNTMEVSNTTLSLVPPTFAGVTSVFPGIGTLGYQSGNVLWGTPQSDGVWDSFRVTYMAEPAQGHCSDPWTGATTAPPSMGISPPTIANPFQLSGLTRLTWYRVKVNAVYAGVSPNLIDSNSTCMEFFTAPAAPSFSGVTSVVLDPRGQPGLSLNTSAAGFTTLDIGWSPVPSGQGSFSYYEIVITDVSPAPLVQVPPNPSYIRVLSQGQGTYPQLTDGLLPNHTYSVTVTAYYDDGTDPRIPSQPSSKSIQIKMTPPSPAGDTLTVKPLSPTQLSAIYTAPLATLQNGTLTNLVAGGLFNQVFLFISTGDPAIWRAAVGTPSAANIGATMAAGATEIAVPAMVNHGGVMGTIIAIPPQSLNADPTGKNCNQIAYCLSSTAFTIDGLTPGTAYNMQMVAVYWDPAHPEEYLSSAGSTQSGTPVLSCPLNTDGTQFLGIYQLLGNSPSSSLDFSSGAVTWSKFTPPNSQGTTCFVDISITSTPGVYDWNASAGADYHPTSPYHGMPCSSAGSQISPTLMAATVSYPTAYYRKQIYAAVRVGVTANATTLYCPNQSPGISQPRFAMPLPIPSGDGVDVNGLVNKVPNSNGPDEMDIPFLTPAPAPATLWNKILVFREASSVTDPCALAKADATDATNLLGPAGAPYAIINSNDPIITGGAVSSGPTWGGTGDTPHFVFKDMNVTAGVLTCYVFRAAFTDGSGTQGTGGWSNNNLYYSASVNFNTVSASTSLSIVFSGVQAGPAGVTLPNVSPPTWPDGTGKIRLNFINNPNPPSGNISAFYVYYSPTGSPNTVGTPWQIVWHNTNGLPVGPDSFGNNYTDYDPSAGNSPATVSQYIFVGGQHQTVSGAGNFIVRAWHFGYNDPNSSVGTIANVPGSLSNLTYIPPSLSGLSYGYYLMNFEASLTSGTWGADSINGDLTVATAKKMGICNGNFLTNPTQFDANCGTIVSTAKVQSTPGSTPVASVNWHQAWTGCRNSSTGYFAMRLPEPEEWRRAARFASDNYSNLWSTYQSSCNVGSGAVRVTGQNSACRSAYSIYDLGGNVREWTDERWFNAGLSRFGYTANSAQSFGLDGLSFVMNNLSVPGDGSGLGLLMGTDFRTQNASNFLFPSVRSALATAADVETETYEGTKYSDVSTGFRCVALARNSLPTMAQETLAGDQSYGGGDVVPENLYVGNNKPESVSITSTYSAGVTGSVTLSWAPWTKTVCDASGSCTTSTLNTNATTYYVYRFLEPTIADTRPSITWALKESVGATPYTGPTPLDPLAITSGATRLWTLPSGGMAISGASCSPNCSFTDSPGSNSYSYANSAYGGTFQADEAYIYLIVAQDPDGNLMPARIQSYHSPYFVGDTSKTYATATFRSQLRYRRASLFPVNETYENGADRQTMVHVALDKSGLDHDYYIYKYEASQGGSSGYDNAGGSDQLPNATVSLTSTTWANYAAACLDDWLTSSPHRLSTVCGPLGSGIVNATTATFYSRAGDTEVGATWGNAYTACKNTSFSDMHGFTYHLYLPSSPEWVKAADWGDTNRTDGVIRDNSYMTGITLGTTTVNQIEPGGGQNKCSWGTTYTGTLSPVANNIAPNCISRFGAVGMAGQQYEITDERTINGVGLDTHDGLMRGFVYPASAVTLDLLRGAFTTGGSTINFNSSMYGQPANNATNVEGRGCNSSTPGGRFCQGEVNGAWATRCAF